MPAIHPTAIVDPQAKLADDVEIGPNCVIEGDVTIGSGTRLLHSVHIQGPATIGCRCTIYHFTCIGFPPQDRKFDPSSPSAGVVIGDDNILRESVTIHRATGARPTTLGDRNYLMVASHVGHDSIVGHDCTIANATLLAGHTTIGDAVMLGGNCGVHQFCRVGRLAMISGLAAIMQDVPPFCVVYSTRYIGSLNIVGLRRAGLRQHIAPLQRAFAIFYNERHSNIKACELIERELAHDPLCQEFAQFIRTTKRGITSNGDPADERGI